MCLFRDFKSSTNAIRQFKTDGSTSSRVQALCSVPDAVSKTIISVAAPPTAEKDADCRPSSSAGESDHQCTLPYGSTSESTNCTTLQDCNRVSGSSRSPVNRRSNNAALLSPTFPDVHHHSKLSLSTSAPSEPSCVLKFISGDNFLVQDGCGATDEGVISDRSWQSPHQSLRLSEDDVMLRCRSAYKATLEAKTPSPCCNRAHSGSAMAMTAQEKRNSKELRRRRIEHLMSLVPMPKAT